MSIKTDLNFLWNSSVFRVVQNNSGQKIHEKYIDKDLKKNYFECTID